VWSFPARASFDPSIAPYGDIGASRNGNPGFHSDHSRSASHCTHFNRMHAGNCGLESGGLQSGLPSG
jgi:hypothetical protein